MLTLEPLVAYTELIVLLVIESRMVIVDHRHVLYSMVLVHSWWNCSLDFISVFTASHIKRASISFVFECLAIWIFSWAVSIISVLKGILILLVLHTWGPRSIHSHGELQGTDLTDVNFGTRIGSVDLSVVFTWFRCNFLTVSLNKRLVFDILILEVMHLPSLPLASLFQLLYPVQLLLETIPRLFQFQWLLILHLGEYHVFGIVLEIAITRGIP